MKKVLLLCCLAILVLRPTGAFGDMDTPQKFVEWLSSKGVDNLGGQTLKDIEGFQTTWSDPGGKTTLEFNAFFENSIKDPEDTAEYQASGTIPFKVSADLTRIQKKGLFGKARTKNERGNVSIYILDANGKVVLEKEMSLVKICSS